MTFQTWCSVKFLGSLLQRSVGMVVYSDHSVFGFTVIWDKMKGLDQLDKRLIVPSCFAKFYGTGAVTSL